MSFTMHLHFGIVSVTWNWLTCISLTVWQERFVLTTNSIQDICQFTPHSFPLIINCMIKESLPLRKSNYVYRQSVQTAWFEEDILEHVSYLQASCLLKLTGGGIKCGVSGEHLLGHCPWWTAPASLLFPLAAPHTRFMSHKFCPTESTQNLYSRGQMCSKWTKLYCSLSLSLHMGVLCSLWLGEGGSIISFRVCAWPTLHCAEPRHFWIQVPCIKILPSPKMCQSYSFPPSVCVFIFKMCHLFLGCLAGHKLPTRQWKMVLLLL